MAAFDVFSFTLTRVRTNLSALKLYLIAQYLKLGWREQFWLQIWRNVVPCFARRKAWILMVIPTNRNFFHPLNDRLSFGVQVQVDFLEWFLRLDWSTSGK